MAEKVVMEYLLGDREFIGCLNRSRPVGEKPVGEDTRKRIRFGWKLRRPVPISEEQANSTLQRFFDMEATKYGNVEMAKKWGIFPGGKSEGELTDAELLALDGTIIEVDIASVEAFMADYDSESAVERGSIESEFKAAAAYFRNVKEDAAKQAKEAGDTARAEKLTAEGKEFTAAYVKGVYQGTKEATEARTKAIKKKVDSIKKTSDGDADI